MSSSTKRRGSRAPRRRERWRETDAPPQSTPARWRTSGGVAIDLGTATIRIGTVDRVLLEEPAVIALDRSGRVIAAGLDARAILGRNPAGIDVVEPLAGAVITDVGLAEQLLEMLLRRAGVHGRAQRTVVVAMPLPSTGLQRRAVLQCVQRALPRGRIVPLEVPMAAAIGSGLPVEEAYGSMVVDVGRGVTEAAVVSLGAMVTSSSAAVGGASADDGITRHLRDAHDLSIGQRTAERVVRSSTGRRRGYVRVRGMDRSSGLPRAVEFADDEVTSVLDGVLESISAVARNALDAAPAELAADVMQGTIMVTGGAGRLQGLAAQITATTGVGVTIPELPDRAVIDGARLCLQGPTEADGSFARHRRRFA